MKVNIGTSCDGEHCFFQFKKWSFFERKLLQYTKLSKKLRVCTLHDLINQNFTLSFVLASLSIPCAGRKQHSNSDFLPKSVNTTLQTSVDIANEYLQAYKIAKGEKKCLFVVCSLVNLQVIQ